MTSLALTTENFPSASFEQWQYTLGSIYASKNEPRKPSDMWLRTVSDASKVGEAVRKGDAYEAMKYMVHTMSWIITTTNKLLEHTYNGNPALQTYDGQSHTSLTRIVLAKYPLVCPVCQQESCHCPVIRRKIEEASPEERKRIKALEKEKRRDGLLTLQKQLDDNDRAPRNIADIAEMLDKIYGQVHYGESVQNITFHFLEEVGEVAWCITSLEEGMSVNKNDNTPVAIQLADEISDVVAWSLAIIGKLATSADQANRLTSVLFQKPAQSSNNTVNFARHSLLARWLWTVFYDPIEMKVSCPSCRNEPCSCQKS